MYIFRWLMKNPIIMLGLFAVTAIAIISFSMTDDEPSKTAAEDKAQVEKLDSAEADLPKAPAVEPSALTSALIKEGDNKDEVDATASEKAEAPTETKEAATEEAKPATAEAETLEASDEAEATAEKSEVDRSDTEVAEKTEETPAATESAVVESTVVTDAPKSEEQFSESSTDELLLMAREAYWNNGLDESAEIYQQLIALNPEVVDYKGELGNVYWRQGFPKKAAELYAEISLPMIEQGNSERVANMVGFIGLFFPEKATEIHNVLQAGK